MVQPQSMNSAFSLRVLPAGAAGVAGVVVAVLGGAGVFAGCFVFLSWQAVGWC